MERLQKALEFPACKKQARIMESDGEAERIISLNLDDLIHAYPRFWAHLTLEIDGKKPTTDDILDLAVPDQRFLAIEIWRLGYGDILTLCSRCDKCGLPLDFNVPLDKLPLLPLPSDCSPPDPTWSVKLPRDGATVVMGYMNGRQELEESEAGTLDLNRIDFKSIRSFGGKNDFSYETIKSLVGRDHKAIRQAAKQHQCGYDTNIKAKCTHCQKAQVVDLMSDPTFVFPGLVF